MNNLKSLVAELFENDLQMRILEKEVKIKTAQYYQQIQKNSEGMYTDSEILTIYSIHVSLQEIKEKQEGMQKNIESIKSELAKFIVPLNGGRWIHETDDSGNSLWEFWLEEEELKFARLKTA
jgi:hypothetical protein